VTGAADWYAWGLKDSRDHGLGSTDVTEVGVQAFPNLLVFAIAVKDRASTFADKEFDILIDINGDASDDYAVVAIDQGVITGGSPTGIIVVAVFDLNLGGGAIRFTLGPLVDASTLLVPVRPSHMPGMTAANPRFSYHVASFLLTDSAIFDEVDGVAKFNAFTPAISTGGFTIVDPNQTGTEAITYDATEFALTPSLGFMIVSQDNRAANETETIPIR
jgi:hypothetical protein